jgi:D-cysteine desulfhydrase family pyridoxal phosphate-dependent enzyme
VKLPQRVSLGTFPTPLDPLPNLSRHLGREVFAKRDDLTGLALGGNKIRKLEMLMAEALELGADVVVTTGKIQSNHCRCTAAAAARLGLGCVLVLFEGRHNQEQGNLLLDRLLGADIRVHAAERWPDVQQLLDSTLEELRAAGRRPYLIPFGGSVPLGAAAYAWGYLELTDQLRGRGPGSIVCVTSSGGMHAGLVAGSVAARRPQPILGVAIGDPAAECEPRVLALARATAELIEGPAPEAADVRVLDGFQGDGYGEPTAAAREAISLLARLEGIFLDPVYTAKAMAALLASAAELDPPIVFVHSGGVPALFAYAPDLTG